VRWAGSLREARGESDRSGVDEGAATGVRGITGVILSNELIDALPVHLVQVVDDTSPRLAEVYVDVDPRGGFIEQLEPPSSPAVAEYLGRFNIPWRTYGAGWRAEVNLAAEQWMREATCMLDMGFVLTIDYGASARRFYTRDRRHGTLAVYSRHQFGDRPLAAPGRQDITAHVNFSALARVGCEQGLAVAGYTTQSKFLRRLGVVEAARMLGQQFYPEADSERQSDHGQAAVLRRRMLESAAATLLAPRGLGGFRVLVQQRGEPNARHELTGLRRG
jgi:SAM-dependent MidA family methyltransferase